MCNVLFVCRDNAVLGPMAEACLNRAARGGSLRAFSAAVHPAARLAPAVERLLRGRGHATDAFQPKSWEVFALPHAPAPDLLIGLDVRLPVTEPAWSATPQRHHWQLGIDPGARAAADIPGIYRLVERAVGEFLAHRAELRLPRAG